MKEVIRLELGSKMFVGCDNMIEKNVGVGTTFPLHTHNYYEYFLVTSGRAMHIVNGMSQVVSRGSLVFVRPSDVHYYDYYKEDDFEFWNAGVPKGAFSRVMNLYNVDESQFCSSILPPHVHLGTVLVNDTNLILETLKNTPDSKKRNNMYMMVLSRIVYLMLTCSEPSTHTEIPSWMLAIIQNMDKPENFIAGLPRLLQLANYSQAHVNRSFKQYLYTTPTHYINGLRLRHAYKLLTETDDQILTISNACGFNNISYFYALFKKMYGMCPNELRKGSFPGKKKIK